MTHKRILTAALALALLLSLCGCSKPSLYTSERLEVEIKGEGTKTLTVTLMGPTNSLYVSEISVPEWGDSEVYSIKRQKTGEDYIKLKLSGKTEGIAPLVVTYSDGDIYALLNVSVNVDEKNKITAPNVIVSGDAPYETLGEEMPEGSQISKGESASKLITLPSADGPWTVDEYDKDVLKVDDMGVADGGVNYEFLVSGIANGSGSASFVNRFSKQRAAMDFQVTSIINGDIETTDLQLIDSRITGYSETESNEYKESASGMLADIRKFSPDVFVPASAMLTGCGSDEGYLDISLELDDNELGYLVFKDISLEDELAEFKKAFPAAVRDSFETSGVKVELFQIEDYAVTAWEKKGLLCELYMFDESDIIKAGDIVESFLSDTGL